MIIFLISLALGILLESSITTVPLTLVSIIFLAVSRKSNDVFLIAFLAGLILDILSFSLVGISSIYFVTVTYLIFLYQKKFEIETLNFLLVISFFGSFFYALMDGILVSLLQSLAVVMITAVSYLVFRKFNKKIPKYA